ncbi:MAG: glycosyltransferase, partial [Candidatus Binatia bacterium]
LSVVSQRMKRQLGMTSTTEQAYFRWYARHIYTGRGQIVDLGCWLGSTTISLATGLTENRHPAASLAKVHAYDNFIWNSSYDAIVASTALGGRYRAGQSFLDEFRRRIAPWKDRIEVHPADLCHAAAEDGAIEFLLIDAMKSWDLANGIVRNFFPALMPGSSFILHQDFAHCYTPWIHLIHYRLRDCFEPVYDIPLSSSVVFRLRRDIPRELLTPGYQPESFTTDEIESAFDYSLSIVCRDKRPNVVAAKIMHYIRSGDRSRAERELEKCRSQGLTFASDLSIVEARLATPAPKSGKARGIEAVDSS